MELKTDFETFLKEIRPTKDQRDEQKTGHETLRCQLRADEKLAPIIVSDFLQGSYKRATTVRPKEDKKSDVDIIVVTNLSEDKYTPRQALDMFEPFVEKYYKGKWQPQGRSIGINLSYVALDLVITSAPSEADARILLSEAVTKDYDIEEAPDWRLHPSWLGLDNRIFKDAGIRIAEAQKEAEWKSQPLRIPDREANIWEDTHPLEQLRWTREKNANCNGHFVNVVKAIKWWRLENYTKPEEPKGFPLERLVGDCCADDISSVALGIVVTLGSVVDKYAGGKPFLADYGVPSHDVLKRVSTEDFAKFYEQAKEGFDLAKRAYESSDRAESGNLWRKLLGNKFPEPPDNGGKKSGGYTERVAVSSPVTERFA